MYKPKCLATLPNCIHKKKTFCCSELLMQDVRRFHQAFYASWSKIVQDQFILKHTSQQTPQRRGSSQNRRSGNGVAIPYFIHTKNKRMVQVCSKAFTSILGVSTFRVHNICKVFSTMVVNLLKSGEVNAKCIQKEKRK